MKKILLVILVIIGLMFLTTWQSATESVMSQYGKTVKKTE